MRIVGLLAIIAMCAAGILAGIGPRPLTVSEALATTGGEIKQDFECRTVATCDSLNEAYGVINPCPVEEGHQSCWICQFGSTNVTNCLSRVGFYCNQGSPTGTDCGLILYGTCNWGNTCLNLMAGTAHCSDGPACTPWG